MKRRSYFLKLINCGVLCSLMLSGCLGKHTAEKETVIEQGQIKESVLAKEEEIKNPKISETKETEETKTKYIPEETTREPEIVEADWSNYFDGLQGAAVVYDAQAMQFTVYNQTLAQTRRSPCSTFKIISSLIALENEIIQPDNSTREWSGETFWNEKWNGDMEFAQAFRESCVWYFREIIDEIGQERMQEELDKLSYGNGDISDWEGRLNTNNNNRALTGFWIESSLAISPKEQTEVMERIFGEDSVYSEESRNRLKEVMRVEEHEEPHVSIYGKTGMGKAQGVLMDAWFTGFAEREQGNIYFCVYLGRTDDKNVSSATAKEIAIQLTSDVCNP